MGRPDDTTLADRRKTEDGIRRLRDSIDLEDEDSAVINLPIAPPKKDSIPGPAKGIVAVLEVLPPWARLPALLAVIGAATYGGHQLGWW
jgi:hypothetical protein